jgi:hypothetical protein
MFRERFHTLDCGVKLIMNRKVCEVPDDILTPVGGSSNIDYKDIHRISFDGYLDRSGTGKRKI